MILGEIVTNKVRIKIFGMINDSIDKAIKRSLIHKIWKKIRIGIWGDLWNSNYSPIINTFNFLLNDYDIR